MNDIRVVLRLLTDQSEAMRNLQRLGNCTKCSSAHFVRDSNHTVAEDILLRLDVSDSIERNGILLLCEYTCLNDEVAVIIAIFCSGYSYCIDNGWYKAKQHAPYE